MSVAFQSLLNEHDFMPRGQLQESQQCISNRRLDRLQNQAMPTECMHFQ
jgi:hypothetical protein